jgi:hypothetical protein
MMIDEECRSNEMREDFFGVTQNKTKQNKTHECNKKCFFFLFCVGEKNIRVVKELSCPFHDGLLFFGCR